MREFSLHHHMHSRERKRCVGGMIMQACKQAVGGRVSVPTEGNMPNGTGVTWKHIQFCRKAPSTIEFLDAAAHRKLPLYTYGGYKTNNYCCGLARDAPTTHMAATWSKNKNGCRPVRTYLVLFCFCLSLHTYGMILRFER